MIRLSVNVNKVATLRNSRGGREPRVLDAVDVLSGGGCAGGITVHPRADRRHITPEDVRDDRRRAAGAAPAVEYNIEGDPRPDLLALVLEVAAGSVHARAGCAWGDDQSGGLAAGPGDRRSAGRDPMRSNRAAFASACSSTVRRTPCSWPRRSAPTAWSCTLSRSLARSSAAPSRPRRRSSVTRKRRAWRDRSAWASTPATISIWRTWCCSASFRISMRCRSATRSSRARSLPASNGRS